MDTRMSEKYGGMDKLNSSFVACEQLFLKPTPVPMKIIEVIIHFSCGPMLLKGVTRNKLIHYSSIAKSKSQ